MITTTHTLKLPTGQEVTLTTAQLRELHTEIGKALDPEHRYQVTIDFGTPEQPMPVPFTPHVPPTADPFGYSTGTPPLDSRHVARISQTTITPRMCPKCLSENTMMANSDGETVYFCCRDCHHGFTKPLTEFPTTTIPKK